MTAKIHRLIEDARTALETIELADQGQFAIDSATWLESIARKMLEELMTEE